MLSTEQVGIEEQYAPHSTFWLVRDDSEIVAVSNLRHHLTPTLERRGGHIGYGVRPSARQKGYAKLILQLTLEEARRRAISPVLLTVTENNLASRRAILHNNGVFVSEEFLPERNEPIQRYLITL